MNGAEVTLKMRFLHTSTRAAFRSYSNNQEFPEKRTVKAMAVNHKPGDTAPTEYEFQVKGEDGQRPYLDFELGDVIEVEGSLRGKNNTFVPSESSKPKLLRRYADDVRSKPEPVKKPA